MKAFKTLSLQLNLTDRAFYRYLLVILSTTRSSHHWQEIKGQISEQEPK